MCHNVTILWRKTKFINKRGGIGSESMYCWNKMKNKNTSLYLSFMSYFCYLCLFTYSGVEHLLCCSLVLFFFALCTLCCQFLWIVHVWVSLRYSLTFVCHCSLYWIKWVSVMWWRILTLLYKSNKPGMDFYFFFDAYAILKQIGRSTVYTFISWACPRRFQ